MYATDYDFHNMKGRVWVCFRSNYQVVIYMEKVGDLVTSPAQFSIIDDWCDEYTTSMFEGEIERLILLSDTHDNRTVH